MARSESVKIIPKSFLLNINGFIMAAGELPPYSLYAQAKELYRTHSLRLRLESSMSKKMKKYKRYLPLYFMMIPGLVYLIINNYIPMGGIIIAFKKFNYAKGILGSPWTGLDNFEFLFKTKEAWTITRNTLVYNMLFIVIGTVLAVAVAILLNELKSVMAKKVYQTVILVPFLISIVVVSYLVYGFLSTDTGFINRSILQPMGKNSISWYSDPTYWPIILVIVNVWKNLGYNCIIYYATVVGLDTSLYESAAIDGAGRWKRIWHITLPGLKTTIITLVLMSVGRVFYSDFGLFYQVPMNSGPLIDVTNTIDTYVYRGLMELNNIGMASAAAVYQSLVGFILVLSANMLVRKIDRESALF